MNHMLKIFLSLSLSGSILILILFFCRFLLKDKMSRQWQYYIWLIVIARLLLPFTPETNLVGNIFQDIDHIIQQTDKTISLPVDKTEEYNFQNIDFSTPYIHQTSDEDITNQTANIQPVQDIIILLKNNIWLLWLITALILLIRSITIYQSFARYIKAGQIPITDIEYLDKLAMLEQELNIKKAVELSVNPLISSPLLIGFFRPCIVLPSENMSETEFHYTIWHELTHYQRRDMFYKWLVQITICLHWFNPLVYLMGYEINKACELSCDEAIIRRLNINHRKDYGRILLDAMNTAGNYKERFASIPLNQNKKLLKERLGAIMKFKKKSKIMMVFSIILTIALLVGASFTGAYALDSSGSKNLPLDLPVPNIKESISSGTYTETISESDYQNRELIFKKSEQATSYAIECVSEKIMVKQEGSEFKIEVSPESKNSYLIRNNTNIPYKDRYNKWDIIVERKEGISAPASFSSTIFVTIPENTENQVLYLFSQNGDIYAEGLKNVNISAKSKNGNIHIINTNATDIYTQSQSGNIILANIISEADIEIYSIKGTIDIQYANLEHSYTIEVDTDLMADIIINNQPYNGGNYTIGNGEQRMILKGEKNSIIVSNITVADDNDSKDLLSYDEKETAKEEKKLSYRTESLIHNFKPYNSYGLSYNEEQDIVFYNGQEVKMFVDLKEEFASLGYSFQLGYFDDKSDSTLYLMAKHDENGMVIGIETMSEELKKVLTKGFETSKPAMDREDNTENKNNGGNSREEYTVFDATTYISTEYSEYSIMATDKLNTMNIPKEISDWISTCPSSDTVNVKRTVADGKIDAWIYYESGKRFAWNMDTVGTTINIRFKDYGSISGPTIIHYQAPDVYQDLEVFYGDQKLTVTIY